MSRSAVDKTTIAAISTPPGAGGIGIIRVSGPQSLHILQTIFRPHSSSCSFVSHQLYFGRIVRPVDGKIMDEVLVVFMRSPRTYTREDVAEIHCHGSFLVLQNILELILSLGVSLADPGEFTKRAFLNGRIDLTQAEAVIDILTARTRKGVDLAQEQLAGALFSRIDSIRNELIQMRAVVEVAIDFPDEDVEIINSEQLQEQLRENVTKPLRQLLQGADNGRIFRDGISVVIVGLPNVGKSSLLNTILQEDRALVTAIPGTTRDTIEEYVDIEGIPVRIIDTAGIREHADEVEALGIERARTQINQADLILFMVDGSQKLAGEDIDLFRTISHKPVIIIINKIDIIHDDCSEDYGIFQDCSLVRVSAKQQMGIDVLKKSIFGMVTAGKGQWQEEACSPNIRHKDALIRADSACGRVKDGLQCGLTNDLLAVDLQECLDQLDEIVGATTTEDILDAIFTKFCIGK
jgi:tRNA modification GTPase